MPEIRRIAVLGAGAMGAFFASRFSEVPEFVTTLVAGGQRYDRLSRNALVVNKRRHAVPVTHPAEAGPPADLIIVAVKHHHLPDAVGDLRNLIGDETTIISVMNGLDSEEYIGSVYGMEKMLYTVSVGIDALREGYEVTFTKPGKHYFGEAVNTHITPRVQRLQVVFERAGIPHEIPLDMMRMLWWKFMVNVGMNQASAVMRAPYGVFQSSPVAQALMETLMREVSALARVMDVNLVEQDVDDWYPVLNTMSPLGKTSMLQDIEAGRKTEVEMFAGKVVELGERHDVPTPVNRAVLQIIQVLEQNLG